MTPSNVLLSIDCLFDTVLGAVREANDDWVPVLIKNGYNERYTNKLSLINPDIKDDLVDAAFQKRSVSTLKLTYTTPVLSLLARQVEEQSVLSEDHPDKRDIVITINTAPFDDLQDFEIAEIARMVGVITQLPSNKVKTVNIPMRSLTPAVIKASYTQFIIHDLHEWTGYHLSALQTTSLLGITCVAPYAIHPTMNLNEYQEGVEKALETSYSSHLDVEIVPLSVMSKTIEGDSE